MDTLRSKIIRLAHQKPELRFALLPLIQKSAKEFATEKALGDYLHEHPDADKSKHSVVESEKSKGDSKETSKKSPAQAQDIKDAKKEGGVSSLQWSGEDLAGENLRGSFITSSNLSKANLSKADLDDSFIEDSDLSHADLSGSTLTGVRFKGSDLSHADLSGADLTGAHLDGATLYKVKFNDKTKWPKGFTPKDWDKIEADAKKTHEDWVKKHPDGKRTVDEFVSDSWKKLMGKKEDQIPSASRVASAWLVANEALRLSTVPRHLSQTKVESAK